MQTARSFPRRLSGVARGEADRNGDVFVSQTVVWSHGEFAGEAPCRSQMRH